MPKTLILIRCAENFVPSFAVEGRSNIVLVRSYYGKISADLQDREPYFHHYEGGKWSGIFSFFQAYPDLLEEFDYFWFPDDDILTNSKVAVDFINISINEGFALCQPALTADSYWAHAITLANPRFDFRRTNFVELMMPMIKRELLLNLLPLFEERHAAMGVDFFWHQLAKDPYSDVAIVDLTPMTHSRPRRKLLQSAMKERDLDIYEESVQTIKQFAVRRQMPIVTGGRYKDGRLAKGQTGGLLLALLGGMRDISHRVHRPALRLMNYLNTCLYQLFSNAKKPTYSHQAYKKFLEGRASSCRGRPSNSL